MVHPAAVVTAGNVIRTHERRHDVRTGDRLLSVEVQPQPHPLAVAKYSPGIAGLVEDFHMLELDGRLLGVSAHQFACPGKRLEAATAVVAGDGLFRLAVEVDLPARQADHPVAHRLDGKHVVRHHDHRRVAVAQPPGVVHALALERQVPDRQHLIDQQHVRAHMGGDRERQADVHPAGVALHGQVHEPVRLGELDDVIVLAHDLPARHAHDRAVEEDILTPGQLRVKPGAHFEEAAQVAADLDLAAGGGGDAAEDLEQR